jgi:hypothetical protein
LRPRAGRLHSRSFLLVASIRTMTICAIRRMTSKPKS